MQNMSAVIDDSNPSKEIDVTTPAALSSLDKIYIYTTLMFWIKKYFVVTGSLTDCSHQGEGGRVISVRIVFFSFSSVVFRQAFLWKKKNVLPERDKIQLGLYYCWLRKLVGSTIVPPGLFQLSYPL